MGLYCSITNVPGGELRQVTVSASHGSASSLATFETKNLHHSLGEHITIDMGYTDNHRQLFSGYVKGVERSVPDDTYTITANDDLVRAADFFIVSSNPNTPLTYSNISGESLVTTVLGLSGLTSFSTGTTSFTFGVSNEFEVNQVSAFDFCRGIADLLAWTIWCDENGTVHFKNRKPFVMSGSEPQPDWVNDSDTSGYVWDDENKMLQGAHSTDENNLRNRVVVYGATGIFAEAQDSSSPYFHYKTAVLADSGLIDDQGYAQSTADYNLHLLNRITEGISATVVGDPVLTPFKVITVDSDKLEQDGLYYIFGAEHSMGSGGYTTKLELRK